MFNKKTKLKLTDFQCNLLIYGMNEFRNMLLSDSITTEDVDEPLLKIINQSERQGDNISDFIQDFYYSNIEPQECTSSLTAKLKKASVSLNNRNRVLYRSCNIAPFHTVLHF